MPKIFTLGLNETIDDSANKSSRDLYDLVGHNSGNLAFHYAINRLIGCVPPCTPWSSRSEQIDAMGDVGILPCANQLGSHTDMKGLAQNLNGVKSNLVAIGLGAQGGVGLDDMPIVPQGTLEWVDQIVRHAASSKPNITVRGDFTLRVLDHYGFAGKAISLGCPSLLINKSRDLGDRLQQRYNQPFRKVAIAAGHPDWTSMSALESSLVTIMENTKGAYVVQNTYESITLSRGDFDHVDNEYKDRLRKYLSLNLDEPQFDEWIRNYMISFYNIPAWMEYLRRFDFIIGSRIHGVMLAMQAGVPGLCIAHDSRIREMCEKCRIPYVMAHQVAGGINLNEINGLIKFDGKEFDSNREAVSAQYQDFFRNNGIM